MNAMSPIELVAEVRHDYLRHAGASNACGRPGASMMNHCSNARKKQMVRRCADHVNPWRRLLQAKPSPSARNHGPMSALKRRLHEYSHQSLRVRGRHAAKAEIERRRAYR